jgi:hypothetical protein
MEEELLTYLQGYWQRIINELVQSLKDVGRYTSGNTASAIGSGFPRETEYNPATFISDGKYEVNIWMPEYYIFIDEGVSGAVNNTEISQFSYKDKGKGKGGRGQKGIPPISAIKKWMINKGIVGSDFRRARSMPRGAGRQSAIDATQTKLAYAIAYGIWRDGQEPTHFYSNVVNDNELATFEKELLESYGELVLNIIDITPTA